MGVVPQPKALRVLRVRIRMPTLQSEQLVAPVVTRLTELVSLPAMVVML